MPISALEEEGSSKDRELLQRVDRRGRAVLFGSIESRGWINRTEIGKNGRIGRRREFGWPCGGGATQRNATVSVLVLVLVSVSVSVSVLIGRVAGCWHIQVRGCARSGVEALVLGGGARASAGPGADAIISHSFATMRSAQASVAGPERPLLVKMSEALHERTQ